MSQVQSTGVRNKKVGLHRFQGTDIVHADSLSQWDIGNEESHKKLFYKINATPGLLFVSDE